MARVSRAVDVVLMVGLGAIPGWIRWTGPMTLTVRRLVAGKALKSDVIVRPPVRNVRVVAVLFDSVTAGTAPVDTTLLALLNEIVPLVLFDAEIPEQLDVQLKAPERVTPFVEWLDTETSWPARVFVIGPV